jgi:hypothetical protein
MVQSDYSLDDGSLPPFDGKWTGCLLVYVLNEEVDVNRYKVEIFLSLGGRIDYFVVVMGQSNSIRTWCWGNRRNKGKDVLRKIANRRRSKYVTTAMSNFAVVANQSWWTKRGE